MLMPFGENKTADVREVQDNGFSEGLNAELAGKLLKSLAEEDQHGRE